MNSNTIDLLALPSLPLKERSAPMRSASLSQLPSCPAIYFVLAEERILYIGQTVNLAQRWVAHHKWSYLTKLNAVVTIAWLECSDKNLLTKIESALIEQFNPELNGKESGTDKNNVKLVIGKELKIRFKSLCVQSETDMSSVAKELIAAWCEEQEKKLSQEKKRS